MERRSWIKKAEIVNGYKERIKKAQLLIFFNFAGIPANDITNLRWNIKEEGGEMVVGKNTLFYRALMDTVISDHREVLIGPTAVVFAYKDPIPVAKVIYEFAKEFNSDDPLSLIKGGLYAGRFLTPEDIKALAQLPPKEVLVSKLMGVIQAPVVNLVMTLKAVPQKLVLVLKAIEEQKS